MVGTKVAKTLNDRKAGGVYKRPNFPLEVKRSLVGQTFEPGASVSLIARRNDINANLLFKWRRQYLAGSFGEPVLAVAKPETTSLLPVSIIATVPESADPGQEPEVNGASAEQACEVEFARARLRIRGDVSPTMVRLLIRELMR